MKKKEIRMYGRKGGWGRQSLMDQGEKEKLKISLRLRTYGTNLTFVDKALSFGEHNRDFPLSIMRQIQNEASFKYNIPTDRSAWRTKSGIKAWFCEYWNVIKDFVLEEVSKIDISTLKNTAKKDKELSTDLNFDSNDNLADYSNQDSENSLGSSLLADDKEKDNQVPETDFFHYLSIDYLLNDKSPFPSNVCIF